MPDSRFVRIRLETLLRGGPAPIRMLPAVGTGSHIDAIPNAGKYDGVVGVLGGSKRFEHCRRDGFRPTHSIELLVFTSEEPTRFGIGCLGSRMLSGTLSAEAAQKFKDGEGGSLEEVRKKAGCAENCEAVEASARTITRHLSNCISSKGPARTPANSAGSRDQHRGPGEPAHHSRRLRRARGRSSDAGSARRALRRGGINSGHRECARTSGATDTVATVGICEVFPGAVNSIPSRVHLSADIRDTDLKRRDGVMRRLNEAPGNLIGEAPGFDSQRVGERRRARRLRSPI